jgi:phosphoribosylamine--glycine ligase
MRYIGGMNVAVIGSGGREHALVWRLSKSRGIGRIFVSPGNPGTMSLAENVEVDINDKAKLLKFLKQQQVDLVVVGPEDPLADGIVDVLEKEGIRAFGPNREAAQLEADKWFAKELMRSQSIPTAESRSFTTLNSALDYIDSRDGPFVVKATGLAKGKGVTVAYRHEDAEAALVSMMKDRVFGSAGDRVVIEECLVGVEASVLAFVSGNQLYVMDPCQDHKPVDDGNVGPMTGGMGVFCPTPTVTPAILSVVERDVFVPILDGLKREGISYRGVLFAGLMLTSQGPKVLEFNVRFGDPETQVLMMRLGSDLLEILNAVVDGKLDEVSPRWDERAAVGVVAASRGYPGSYPTGLEISGVDEASSLEDVCVFHSGTKRYGAALQTAGGRVLTVTALGADMESARSRAYEAISKISFEGMHYRKDIAARIVAR